MRETRSGRWELQPGGYAAFLPKSLPPEPPLELTPRIQSLLSRADRGLGRLDGSIHTLPHPDLVVFMFVRREAVLSSQIEGTQSSLDDVLRAEARILDPERPRDVEEVLNYVAAMRWGLEHLAELPVSARLVREIHARLLEGVRGGHRTPGELRRTQNWIGPNGAGIREAVFVPPPPQAVPEALAELERFIHGTHSIPLLLKIGLIHAQFETIHPFLDGNGRIGRLLIVFLLCEREILAQPVLYISHYFRRHRQRYYDLLQATRETGAWEDWLEFFLQAVIDTSAEAVETVRRVLDLRERHRREIVAHLGRVAGNALLLLERLFQSPFVDVNRVTDLLGVSFPAANNLVSRMVELGVLSEVTGRSRNRVFRYDEFVQFFAE